jgi:hypothetical protein
LVNSKVRRFFYGMPDNRQQPGGIYRGAAEASDRAARPGGTCRQQEITTLSGLEDKVVSRELKSLKDRGYVDSLQRCRYAITESGRMLVDVLAVRRTAKDG